MPNPSTVVALAPIEHVKGTSKRYSVDCRGLLRGDELLEDPTTIQARPDNITISDVSVNTEAFENDEGQTVAPGQGIELTVGADGSVAKYQLKLITTRADGSGTEGAILILLNQDLRAG